METLNPKAIIPLNFSSYRTYEEWKLQKTINIYNTINSSYRTYEEWKHIPTALHHLKPSSVLTVPMRNGNLA